MSQPQQAQRLQISIAVVRPSIDLNGLALASLPWFRLALSFVNGVPECAGIPDKDISVVSPTVQLEGGIVEGAAVDGVIVTLQCFNDGVVPSVQNVDGRVDGKEDEIAPSCKRDAGLARVARCREAGPQVLPRERVPHAEFPVLPVGHDVESVRGEGEAVDVPIVGPAVRFWRPILPLDTAASTYYLSSIVLKYFLAQESTYNRDI